MKPLFKLTDESGRSRNNTQWGEHVSHSGTGEGSLCSPGWIHVYDSPLLAIMLDPIHGDFGPDALLWKGVASGKKGPPDHGLKFGVETFRTDQQIEKPAVTLTQRIAFGILCAQKSILHARMAHLGEPVARWHGPVH